MSDDPVRIEDTRLWLTKARRDLAAVAALDATTPPLRDIAAYHCQQTGEKALKAFLTWHNKPFLKTHDPRLLLDQCSQIAGQFSECQSDAELLTPLATLYRYPSDEDSIEPTLEELQRAIQATTRIIRAVESRLPAAVTSV